MRTTWLLAAVCVLVLGGALAVSRLLLTDVPVPVAAPAAVPVVVAVAVAVPPVDPPMKVPAVLPLALARQRDPGLVVPSPNPEKPAVVEANGASIPADEAPSPFQGASEELDYAEGLLGERAPAKERLESAHDVFKRCVDQEPANQRCHRALVLARERLGLKSDQSVATKIVEVGGKREARKVEPSSQAEKMSQIRQPAQLK